MQCNGRKLDGLGLTKIFKIQHYKFQTIQNADWSGKGILACYGHFETDASFDEGAANGGDASVSCAPAEWGGNNFDLNPAVTYASA